MQTPDPDLQNSLSPSSGFHYRGRAFAILPNHASPISFFKKKKSARNSYDPPRHVATPAAWTLQPPPHLRPPQSRPPHSREKPPGFEFPALAQQRRSSLFPSAASYPDRENKSSRRTGCDGRASLCPPNVRGPRPLCSPRPPTWNANWLLRVRSVERSEAKAPNHVGDDSAEALKQLRSIWGIGGRLPPRAYLCRRLKLSPPVPATLHPG